MYIPKNKIITDLYTRGNEFQYLSNKEEYSGYYHKLYNGKFYTGKNPNDKPVSEIIRIPTNDAQWEETPLTGETLYSTYTSNFDGETVPGQYQNMREIDVYNAVKGIDINQVFQLPPAYYPTPTEDDYNLGVFTRYFCVKINENVYLEISKDTYDNLTQEKKDWAYELYTPFWLQWTLTGKEKEVELVNSNAIAITEQRLNRRGLREFLKGNYLKFYKP